MVGGAAEKCIAGAPDNGFGAEPVQLSVAAGVGVRYKMNDRLPCLQSRLYPIISIRTRRREPCVRNVPPI